MTVLVAREIEAISDADILGWAVRHVAPSTYAEDADYLQLVRSNPRDTISVENAQGHLRSLIARRLSDFDDKSEQAREIARKLFLRRIRSYLDGEIQPIQVCLMVSPIEDKCDYPSWLGDLYDGCDGMDQNATREQASHLRWMIEKVLTENTEPQPSGSE